MYFYNARLPVCCGSAQTVLWLKEHITVSMFHTSYERKEDFQYMSPKDCLRCLHWVWSERNNIFHNHLWQKKGHDVFGIIQNTIQFFARVLKWAIADPNTDHVTLVWPMLSQSFLGFEPISHVLCNFWEHLGNWMPELWHMLKWTLVMGYDELMACCHWSQWQ